MKKKYKIRHKILSHLYNKITYNNLDVPDLTHTKSTVKEIASAINYPYKVVLKEHINIPEKQASCEARTGEHIMTLQPEGISTVTEEYWLREGEKELNERIFDRTKWAVPIIALAVTLFSVIYSITQISKTQGRLERVEKELYELRAQKMQPNLNSIQRPISPVSSSKK